MRVRSIALALFFLCMVRPCAADPSLYAKWEVVLSSCVTDAGIELKKLQDVQHELYSFLHVVEAVPYATYETWEPADKLAFWLNVYNALSLILILKNPYATVLQELRETPDDVLITLFGKDLSLNAIKHTYIRGMFFDERIHCALAAPARGFPRLRKEAYVGRMINLQLDDDVRAFLNDKTTVAVNREKNIVYLSEVFQWFGVDFIKRYGTDDRQYEHFNVRERAIIRFLYAYRPDLRAILDTGKFTIEYAVFDWHIPVREKVVYS